MHTEHAVVTGLILLLIVVVVGNELKRVRTLCMTNTYDIAEVHDNHRVVVLSPGEDF